MCRGFLWCRPRAGLLPQIRPPCSGPSSFIEEHSRRGVRVVGDAETPSYESTRGKSARLEDGQPHRAIRLDDVDATRGDDAN